MAVLALAAIATATAIALTRSDRSNRGPLGPEIAGGVRTDLVLRLGQSASISGPLIIRNPSDHELVLDRVEAVELRDGSPEILGAYVSSTAHVDHDFARVGYRVPATGRALPGATIGPHKEVQFFFGVKATELGRHRFTALDLLYHDGSGNYLTTAGIEIAVCAPMTVKDC